MHAILSSLQPACVCRPWKAADWVLLASDSGDGYSYFAPKTRQFPSLMNISLIRLAAAVFLTAPLAVSVTAQPRFTGHGFDDAGVFHMTVSGATDVEASTNLQTWAKYATVSQETRLDDLASRQMEWRFYRLSGSSGSNLIGFVKAAIPGGKLAILGNPFAGELKLDSPEGRTQLFGSTNPAVKLSLYANGTFTPHTLDRTSGTWAPALRPIRTREGFSVENTGTRPVTVRFSGVVPQGQLNMNLPAGASLVVPPVPQPGPLALVLGLPAKDGMQIDYFNEQSQAHQVSTFDALDGAWMPKLPDYRPGRALIVKTPAAVTWTKSFSAGAR